jgi:caa(3)-type oxidase subunit IV
MDATNYDMDVQNAHDAQHGHDGHGSHGSHEHEPEYDEHGHEIHTRLERRNWAQETITHQTVATYWKVFAGLAFFMLATIGAAKLDFAHMDMFAANPFWGHALNLIIALVIASIKVTLVVCFFMNAKGGTKLIGVWAALGFIWLPLMGGIFMDYSTRQWVPSPGWQYTPSGTQDPEEVEAQIKKVMEENKGEHK